MLVSEYLGVDLEDTGVFDAVLDKDSNFFINIVRLKYTSVPEFQDAYQSINKYFTDIAMLLANADKADMSDVMYRAAYIKFQFHEVNGINLGMSESRWGAGWGDLLSKKVLADAYQIVKKGSRQPEIFHLVGLFEENVAGDRLSDMIAAIIEPHIRRYSRRMQECLGISSRTRPDLHFTDDDLILNPFKSRVPILLLPEEILHELPIAKDWYDIDRVAQQNETIRREISAEIGEAWEKWASAEQKEYLKRNVFMVPEICERVIEGYRELELGSYNPRENPDYAAEVLMKDFKQQGRFESAARHPSSLEGMMEILGIFKDWVENNRGWAEIQKTPQRQREKAVQRLVHLGAKHYVGVNNLDLSFEPNAGRGPVDVKLSRGNDKTVAEIKLSSNTQCRHGYKVQVKEYGKAERTRSLVYVLVDVGNPRRVANIVETHRANRRLGIPCPELFIVDAKVRSAASTYVGDESEMDADFDGAPTLEEVCGTLSGFNLDDIELTDTSMGVEFDLNRAIDELQNQIVGDDIDECARD